MIEFFIAFHTILICLFDSKFEARGVLKKLKGVNEYTTHCLQEYEVL